MEYVSPGDAFSSSLERSLLQRAAQQRQTQMDQIAFQREERQNRNQVEESRQAQEALAEKRREFADTQKDKRKGSFEKTLGTMVPGDIPSPELIAQAKEFGMGHLFPESEVPGAVAPPPVTMPAPMGSTATEGGMPAPMPEAPPVEDVQKAVLPPPVSARFIGSPTQRKEAAEKEEARKYIDALPDGPQKMALEYSLKTGKNPPAGLFKDPDAGQAVLKTDPKRHVVQRLQPDGSWLDVKGDAPKDAHWLQEPTPPSTAAADARSEGQLTRAYYSATAELNKASAPFEDQLKNLQSAREVLLERSPSGDAHVAPMILKALVAGQGSGFRMTKAEIDQVQNARTVWQSLQAKMRKYEGDPKDALFFDDAQRADFAKLLDTVQKVTVRHLDQIGTARNDIDGMTTHTDIRKRITALHKERLEEAKDDKKPDAPAAAAPKRIRYDVNGKRVE